MKFKIAVIDPNALAALGLKNILYDVFPQVDVESFSSLDELLRSDYDSFFHYFVATNVVLENRQFFIERRMKTIVLTMSDDPNTSLSGFHSICVHVPENMLVKNILMLEQHAHANGRNLPPMQHDKPSVLSDREIEVLSLITQGLLNKEIADKLNIGLTTVISHRKNITEKLGIKSVSALTIYSVMHGYVDLNKI
jgi:DNA-binding CsgD family transcriptional regulator